MKITTYNEWLNENQSPINEGADVQEQIKKICIERLSQFFRVPASKLMKFNFDGKDDVRQYTAALDATSYEGAEQYYKVAIKMAKEELGVHESLEESAKPKVGDELTMVKNGKKGKVVKCDSDMCNVDFGNGDVYGITYRRIKGDKITEEVVNEAIMTIKGARIIANRLANKMVDMGLFSARKKTEDLIETIADVIMNTKMESVDTGITKTVNEGAVKAFEMDFADMVKEIKAGYGWIDPEYVADTWENSSDTIDFELVKDEIYNRLIKAGLLFFADENDAEKKGKKVTNISQIK
jgi:hypothetical protein